MQAKRVDLSRRDVRPLTSQAATAAPSAVVTPCGIGFMTSFPPPPPRVVLYSGGDLISWSRDAHEPVDLSLHRDSEASLTTHVALPADRPAGMYRRRLKRRCLVR